MAIFDKNNPPSAPDSTLDSDLTSVANIPMQNFNDPNPGSPATPLLVPIAPGDWVDLDPSCLPQDPDWGFSYQVADVSPNVDNSLASISILATLDGGVSYSVISGVSAQMWVTDNFRRVPTV